MRWQFKSTVIWLSLVLLPFAAAQALPRPVTHVVDSAGVIDSASEARLAGLLAELEQKTGAQMIVLTLDTTAGEPLETFNIRLLDEWKLGQKGKDNGLLFTVAVKDRKWRIDTGYGLEGLLPDSYLGSLGRAELLPRLKQGDYAGGLTAVSLLVASRIAADSNVSLSTQPVKARRAKSGGHGWSTLLLLLFFILPGLLRPRQRGYNLSRGVYLGGLGGGFGGGLGGGGFGGFGGGGFGGGGAGGSW